MNQDLPVWSRPFCQVILHPQANKKRTNTLYKDFEQHRTIHTTLIKAFPAFTPSGEWEQGQCPCSFNLHNIPNFRPRIKNRARRQLNQKRRLTP